MAEAPATFGANLMPRYVSMKRRRTVRAEDCEWDEAPLTGQTVIEQEGWRDPQPTGLLDASGNDICRLPEPIGFCREYDD